MMRRVKNRAVGWIAVVTLLPTLSAGAAESYDAIFMGAVKVGHTHVKVEPVKDARGRDLLRVQVNMVLSYKRGRDRINVEMRYGTIETLEGAVLSLDVRTQTGQEALRTYGEARDGQMRLILELGRQRQEQLLPWSDEIRGPYAAELTLARQPLKAGESRTLKMFVPVQNSIANTTLRAVARETVPLGGGQTRDLLRVEQTGTDAAGKPLPELETTLWVDDGGQVLRSYSPALGGIDSYRTTRNAALAPNGDFDLLAATIYKLDRYLNDPGQMRSATYQLSFTGGNLAEIFPNDHRQTLTARDDRNATLKVVTDSPTTGESGPPSPGDEFLRPNPLVNSDDPLVVQYAREAVGRKTDPWEKAVAVEEWVARNLRDKNFENVFAPAKEVARTLEGDCTEHSVLTAALCRAVGVPCRVVIGLVYAPPQKGFGPHMWNEVYVNNRWVAIDAAFNQTSVDATHLKMSASSLEGVAPFEAMTPVMRLLSGSLKFESFATP